MDIGRFATLTATHCVRLFFLLTPFMVLSTFLSMTTEREPDERKRLAVRVTGAIVAVTFSLYLFGTYIFRAFGVTLDSFRVGAGALLFLTAVNLVRGQTGERKSGPEDDIAVVPLAIPVTVGPGTTGALLVMSADLQGWGARLAGGAGLLAAVLAVGLILYLGNVIEHALGARGLSVLSKLTGLMISALAAELVLQGLRNSLGG